MPNTGALIRLTGIHKTYDTPAGPCRALADISLDIGRGEFVTLMGRSGSGKSTLLHLIGGLDRPSQGEVHVGETPVHAASEHELSRFRGRTVGVVFQFFQLLPTLTVAENVMLPMDFCGVRAPAQRRPAALALLRLMGVGDQADKLPATLSGGQQQRVAIARALANEPALVLADEPTGNLDTATAAEVLEIFKDISRRGTTVVIATHDAEISRASDRCLRLSDGRLQ